MYSRPLNSPKSGGIEPFVFVQSSAVQTWEILHNLNRVVQVTVVDADDNECLVETTHPNLNKVIVKFGAPETGKAFIT